MKPKRVEILGRELAYQGFFRLERVRLRHESFRGGMGPELVREVVERGDVVAVLLYDPDRDVVVMIEQFRVGAVDSPGGPWLLEVVAGIVEAGESPEDVARREALEETGIAIIDLVPIAQFYATPAKSSEFSTLFCGRVDSRGAGGVHGLAEEGEDIRVVPMPIADVFGALNEGRINSAWPMIAVYWLMQNRGRLRDQWCPIQP